VKTVEESVVRAMDGADTALFPFLPYIFQDIWEIGSSPEVVTRLIQAHCRDYSNLRLLDLGCGKGAVSIRAAAALRCRCLGIDAVEAFVAEARAKAAEYDVDSLCQFEVGDIREKISSLSGFDVIVLGSIGPVFGDYLATLTTLSRCLKPDGTFIIDDGYFEDDSPHTHPMIGKKGEIRRQIKEAGMTLVDEFIFRGDEIEESDEDLFAKLKARCFELAAQYPGQKKLFLDYIKRQVEENKILETEAVCRTMVIRPALDFGRKAL